MNHILYLFLHSTACACCTSSALQEPRFNDTTSAESEAQMGRFCMKARSSVELMISLADDAEYALRSQPGFSMLSRGWRGPAQGPSISQKRSGTPCDDYENAAAAVEPR